MSDQHRKYLADIEKAIEHIEMFTDNIRSFADYSADLLIRRGVEREIEIIGEAMSQLLKLQPQLDIPNARRIVDTRNRIIHGYDSVDDAVVYGIIRRHLPALKADLNKLIGPDAG